MKYYDNDIYPVALVLSRDAESVDKEYYNAFDGEDRPITVKETAQATTMPLARRATYFAMAVGIVFNKEPDARLMAHEAFHATYFMAEMGCKIPLSDSSDEDIDMRFVDAWVCKCERKKDRRLGIVFFIDSGIQTKQLVHESYHALTAYISEINADLPDYDSDGMEEFAAYLLEWIFDCSYKVKTGKIK